MEQATGIEPVLPTWESEFSLLYLHNSQNRLEKINVPALHTVHAVPDLRSLGGHLGDRGWTTYGWMVYVYYSIRYFMSDLDIACSF